MSMYFLFKLKSAFLSQDGKVKKKIIHPNPQRLPLLSQYTVPLKIAERKRNCEKNCRAVLHVCIFIQLSYLSEQIIRGDKLRR